MTHQILSIAASPNSFNKASAKKVVCYQFELTIIDIYVED
jgi:hypothetical protein